MSQLYYQRGQIVRSRGGEETGQALQLQGVVLSGYNFERSFKAKAVLGDGTEVLAQYDVMEPRRNGKAHFHFLLDTSGSMQKRTQLGGRVHEHLFANFQDLVLDGKTLRPDDTISVWCFNNVTKLLCVVDAKSFGSQVADIRASYQKELTQRSSTRLYEAVETVAGHIRKAWEQDDDSGADYFLVSFTDGVDTTSSSRRTTVGAMVDAIHAVEGRMHTVFITANLPDECALSQRLLAQKEMKLIECESMEQGEISDAFLQLRSHIKGVLVAVSKTGDQPHVTTRLASYALTPHALGKNVMRTLEKELGKGSSLLQAVNKNKFRNLD